MRFSHDWSKDSVALVASAILVVSTASAAVAQAVGSDTQSVVAVSDEDTNNLTATRSFEQDFLRSVAIEKNEVQQQLRSS